MESIDNVVLAIASTALDSCNESANCFVVDCFSSL
jgi:hypothetical protein